MTQTTTRKKKRLEARPGIKNKQTTVHRRRKRNKNNFALFLSEREKCLWWMSFGYNHRHLKRVYTWDDDDEKKERKKSVPDLIIYVYRFVELGAAAVVIVAVRLKKKTMGGYISC